MKIVLGSKSPRRKELLSLLGYNFEIRTLDTDESYPLDFPSEKVAEFVANKKADALMSSLKPDELLICADTIVLIENRILGKPTNIEEAKKMLASLMGKTHEVISGIVIASTEKKKSFSVHTKVTFSDIDNTTIDQYVEKFQPLDKAGSYGIQEWIGQIGISKIEGSYTNVVGFPTHEIYFAIKNFN